MKHKNYFKIDNELITKYGEQIGVIGIGIYCVLMKHADQSGKCFPSQDLIARQLKLNERTIRRHTKILEGLGLIRVERNKGKDGKNKVNTYHMLHDKLRQPEDFKSRPEDTESADQRTQSPTNKTHINNTHKQPAIAVSLHGFKDNFEGRGVSSISELAGAFLSKMTVTDKKISPRQLKAEEISKTYNLSIPRVLGMMKQKGEHFVYQCFLESQKSQTIKKAGTFINKVNEVKIIYDTQSTN